MLQMFKFVQNLDFFDFNYQCDIFGKPTFQASLGSASMNTRGHPYKLQTQLCKTAIKKKSFFGRVTTLWNSLGEKTVCSNTINEFKNNLGAEWNNPEDLYGYTFSY